MRVTGDTPEGAMYTRFTRVGSALAFVTVLASCASVDQFGSRIYDSNLNSQDAMEQEALLNVMRAVAYKAPNFVAITQVAGSQTETLNTGLPTFVLGPAQTPAQHQFVFGSNSLSSVTGGTFQSNPLVSTQFQDGMLSPITNRTVAILAHAYWREIVYYIAMESIVVRSQGKLVAFHNDVSRDNYSGDGYSKFGPTLRQFLEHGLSFETVPCGSTSSAETGCTPPAKPAAGGASGGGGQTPQESYGRPCWDPTLASLDANVQREASLSTPQCGSKPVTSNPSPKPPAAAPATASATATAAPFGIAVATVTAAVPPPAKDAKAAGGEKTGAANPPPPQQPAAPARAKTAAPTKLVYCNSVGCFEVGFVFRSPVGVFNYLGKLLRDGTADRIQFYTKEAGGAIDSVDSEGKPVHPDGTQQGKLFKVVSGKSITNCEVTANYQGERYCIPHGENVSLVVLDILQELRNLAIQPSDLNESFTVRVSQ